MKKILFTLLILPLFGTAQKKKITFEDLYVSGTFTAESVAGFHSMKDGKYYTEKSEKGLLKQDFVTGQTIATLINATDIKDEKGNTPPTG